MAEAFALTEADHREIARMVLADLKPVFEATAKGPALGPPINRPPLTLDTLDEKSFKRFRDDLVQDVSRLVNDATKRFVPDHEIEKLVEDRFAETADLIDRVKTDILKEVKTSLEKIVEDIFHELIPEKFAIIGLRIDNPDQIEKTRQMLDELRRMQQTAGQLKNEAFRQIVRAFGWYVGIALTAVAAFFGFRGGSH